MKISPVELIETHLPPFLRPYAYLARLDRPVGIWLLLLPALWAIVLAAGGLFSINLRALGIAVLFAIGAIVMRAAGCIINDLIDRNLDSNVQRTSMRPLASGEIAVLPALVFLILLLGIGAGILFFMNTATVILGLLTLPLIAAYPYMKRITWWPQAFLGVTFNAGALMGWSAVTGGLAFAPVILYLGAALWTLGYDTIYAHQDIVDDERIGIKSTARLFGARSKPMVALIFTLAWCLIALAGMLALPGSFVFMLLLPAAVHMGWLVWRWDPQNAENSGDIFRASRDTGLLILAAFALSG